MKKWPHMASLAFLIFKLFLGRVSPPEREVTRGKLFIVSSQKWKSDYVKKSGLFQGVDGHKNTTNNVIY